MRGLLLPLTATATRWLLILACARIPNMEENMAADTKFRVALSRAPQLGTVRFRRLESNFGDLESVWNASYNELRATGLEDRPAQEIVPARNNSSPDDEMAALERAGVTAVTWNHPGYPARLNEIADPPAVSPTG